VERRSAGDPRGLAVAGAVAIGVVLLLLAVAGQYGFHRDELYFIVAGQHPALGYPDQPPFTPLVTAAAVEVLGLSPVSIRILPALVVGAIIVLAAVITRELGGSPRAQALAAVVSGVGGLLAAGHPGNTATFDLLAWTLTLWLVVRLLAGADPRGWLLVGLIAGIGLENKHTVLFLGFGLAVGLLLARRWEVVRSPWPWLAVALAVLLWAPNLLWQAQHDFPQLQMAAHISGSADENRANLVPELLLIMGAFVFPVALAGAWRLLRSPAARPWRSIGWGAIAVLVLVVVIGAKSYYAAGFIPLLVAAGAISLDGWLGRGGPASRRLRLGVTALALTATGAVSVLLVLPVVPVESLAGTPIPDIYGESAEQVGWPELVATVTGVVDQLPPDQRARAAIMTVSYGEASALVLLGDDLPPVVSGHNGYWDWGPPPDDRTVAVLVGWWSPADLSGRFGSCRTAARIDNGVGVPNEEQGAPVQVCSTMSRPWSVLWPDLRHLS